MKYFVISVFMALLAGCLTSCGGGENGEDADAAEDQGAEDAAADDASQEPSDGEEPDAAEDVQAEDGVEIADVPAEEVEENPASVFCLQMAEAFCDYVAACCSADEQTALEVLVDCGSPEGGVFFHGCYDGIGPYVAGGTAEIYDEAVPGCLIAVSDMASQCPDLNAAPVNREWYMDAGCSEVVRGLLGPSEDCYDSEQCEGLFYCDLASSPSTCVPRKAFGEDCAANDECVHSDPVDHPGVVIVCVSGACGPVSAADGPCDENGDCELGTYCDVDGGGVCREMLAAGSECDTAGDLCAGRCVEGDPPTCADFCDGL